MNDSYEDEDEDGATVHLRPGLTCGICGFEMNRWSHKHPEIFTCLTCDHSDGMGWEL